MNPIPDIVLLIIILVAAAAIAAIGEEFDYQNKVTKNV